MVRDLLKTLERGLQYHRAGKWEAARLAYEQVLEADPHNADAAHLMGMLEHHSGRPQQAAAWIERAVRLRPTVPMFHNNLGTVLQALGRNQEAYACYLRALQLDPNYAEAHNNLGNLLQEMGRAEEALAHYRQALRLAPKCPEAHNNRGNALRLCGRYQEAVASFERALALRPAYAEAWLNLAGALRELGRLEEAEAACRRAIWLNPRLGEAHAGLSAVLLERNRLEEAEQAARKAIALKPELAEAHANLAAALIEQRRFAEASVPCRQALRLNPSLPEALANLGDILCWHGREEEALDLYEQALKLRPSWAQLWNKRGYALEQLGRVDEGLACYEEALRLKPDLAEAHTNRAMAWLRKGGLARGFEEYEWRFQRKDFAVRQFPVPAWDGSSPSGRTILVHAEQGLGDTIQFVRYLPLVEQRGARVLLDCQPRLRCLMPARWLAQPEEGFQLHVPLLSLPRLLGTTLANIPAQVPYLSVEEALIERWRRRLGNDGKLKIGLVWAGNPEHRHDRKRSISPELLAPLARLRGVSLYSLQRGWPTSGVGLELKPLEDEQAPISETAAAIMNLDLVISVDTMVAHLAGALGRRVWLLLCFMPDWRWMLEREDTPWYPTMRLFRQRRPGDWSEVVERLVQELKKLAEGDAGPEKIQSCQMCADKGGEAAPRVSEAKENPGPAGSREVQRNRM